MWELSLLLARGIQETPKTKYTITITLGCPPGVEGKSLFLKISSTLNIELRSELELTWKLLPQDQLPQKKVLCKFPKQERDQYNSPTQIWCPWSAVIISMARQPHGHSGTHVLVATTWYLTGFKAHLSERNHAWSWKLTQLPVASEVMDLKGETSTSTLQNHDNP